MSGELGSAVELMELVLWKCALYYLYHVSCSSRLQVTVPSLSVFLNVGFDMRIYRRSRGKEMFLK